MQIEGQREGPGVIMSKHVRRNTSECDEQGHVEVRTQDRTTNQDTTLPEKESFLTPGLSSSGLLSRARWVLRRQS